MAWIAHCVVVLPDELPADFWAWGVPQYGDLEAWPPAPDPHVSVDSLTWPSLHVLGFSGPVYVANVASIGPAYRLWVIQL